MEIQQCALGSTAALLILEMEAMEPRSANASCLNNRSMGLILRIFQPLPKRKKNEAGQVPCNGLVTVFGEETE